MSKKLLFTTVRISEDLKMEIDKELKRRVRRDPWAKPSVAGFVRETVYFYFRHRAGKEGGAEKNQDAPSDEAGS